MTMTVKDIDKGYRKLQAEFAKLAGTGGKHVSMGILGAETNTEGTPLLLIALVHEFGSPAMGIPQRSWLRSSALKNGAKWMELARKVLGKAADGKVELQVALGLVGEKMLADTKAGIRAGIAPALQPATIARKGSSKPLIDTGQFINSIAYKVADNEG